MMTYLFMLGKEATTSSLPRITMKVNTRVVQPRVAQSHVEKPAKPKTRWSGRGHGKMVWGNPRMVLMAGITGASKCGLARLRITWGGLSPHVALIGLSKELST
jgi:hypothetical protein